VGLVGIVGGRKGSVRLYACVYAPRQMGGSH
jgi:hypothetical protein